MLNCFLYLLSLFMDKLFNKRVQLCYLIKVLSHHSVILDITCIGKSTLSMFSTHYNYYHSA